MTVVVAFSMLMLTAAAGLAIDLGMARVGVRDMQALADVVALDQARLVDGRTTAALLADSNWTRALAASVARNDDTFPSDPDVTAVPGKFETGVFIPTTGTGVPNAVQITASASVDYVLREGSLATARSAVGMNEKTACIAVGSYAAQVKSNSSSLLSALVGDKLGINAVSYKGLADVTFTLSQLAVQLGVGDVDGLATIDRISVGDLYVAIAEVLRANGNTAAASLVGGTLRANVSALPPIDLGGLIAVHNPGDAVLEARMNVLDMVSGAAFLADGDNFVAIPALSVNVNPNGLSAMNLTLSDVRVIQTPVISCGRLGTKASNAQIELTFGGTLASIAIPNPGIALATVNGSVSLKATVALAEGTLSNIDCKQGTPTNPDKVTVDTHTRLLRPELTLGLNVKPVLLPAEPLTVSVRSSEQYSDLPVVVNLPPNVQHMDAGASKLEGGTVTLGPSSLTTAILNSVTSSIVTPVAKGIDSMINGSLRTVVGIDVASADVFAFPRPQCRSSRLVE